MHTRTFIEMLIHTNGMFYSISIAVPEKWGLDGVRFIYFMGTLDDPETAHAYYLRECEMTKFSCQSSRRHVSNYNT